MGKEKTPKRLRFIFILIGIYTIFNGFSIYSTQEQVADRAVLYDRLPIEVRVVSWVFIGFLVLFFSFDLRTFPLAVAASVIMPVERAISHFWSWFAYLIPGPPGGDPIGFAHTIKWGAVVLLFIVLGSWATTKRRELPDDLE